MVVTHMFDYDECLQYHLENLSDVNFGFAIERENYMLNNLIQCNRKFHNSDTESKEIEDHVEVTIHISSNKIL